jgi:hypothetical protein
MMNPPIPTPEQRTVMPEILKAAIILAVIAVIIGAIGYYVQWRMEWL